MIDPDLNLVISNNGQDAFSQLEYLVEQGRAPRLIVLDLNMPVWDGLKTLRELKSSPQFANLPVLLFSTTNNAEERNTALELGAIAFVTKPTSYRELEVVIGSFRAYFEN